MAVVDPSTVDTQSPQSSPPEPGTPVRDPAETTPGETPPESSAQATTDSIDAKLAQAASPHLEHPEDTTEMDAKHADQFDQENSIDAKIAAAQKRVSSITGEDPTGKSVDPLANTVLADDTDASNAVERMQLDQAKGLVNFTAGAAKFAEDAGHGILQGLHGLEDWLASKGIGRGDIIDPNKRMRVVDSLTPQAALANSPQAQAQATIGKFAIQTALFMEGGAIAGGSKLVQGMRGAGIAAATSFAAFDPNEKRLSDMAQEHPWLANPISAFLASNPGDTELDSRFKNAAESLLMDAGLATVFHGILKGYQGVRWMTGARGTEEAAKALPEAARGAEQAAAEGAHVGEGVGPSGASTLPPEATALAQDAKAADVAVQDAKNAPAVIDGATQDAKAAPPPESQANPGVSNEVKVGDTIRDTSGKLIDINPRELKDGETLDSALKDSRINWLETTDKGNPRYERANATMDKNVVAQNTQVFEGAQRTTTVKETQQAALDLLARDPEFYARKQIGDAWSDVEIMALNGLKDHASNQVEAFVRDTDFATATPQELANHYQTLSRYQELVLAGEAGASEQGRALRMSRESTTMINPTAKESEKYIKTLLELNGGEEFLRRRMIYLQAAIATGKPEVIANLRRELVKSPWRSLADTIFQVKVSMMLASVNGSIFVGNAVKMAQTLGEITVAGLHNEGKALLGYDMGRISGGTVVSAYKGAWDGISQAAVAWAKDIKEAAQARELRFPKPLQGPNGIPFSDIRPPAISASAYGMNPGTGAAKIVDWIGEKSMVGNKMAMAGDDFWKFANHRMSLSMSAHEEAGRALELGGDYEAVYNSVMKNPTEAMEQKAQALARENTYQVPLVGALKDIEGVIKGTNNPTELNIGSGFLRFLAPFTTISGNVIQNAMELTPGLNTFSPRWRAVMAGKDEAAKEILKARVAIGSTFYAAGGMWAMNGNLTGNGPAEPRARRLWLESNRPYSFRLSSTGNWHEFNRNEPVGIVLGTAADLHDMAHYAIEKKDYEGAAYGALAATAMHFTPEFLTETFTGLSVAVGTNDESMMQRILANQATSFIPGGVKQIARTVDPVKRVTRADPEAASQTFSTILNEVKKNIPFWSKTLPPAQNMFGHDVTYTPGVTVDSASVTYNAKDSPSLREMLRMQQTGPLLRPTNDRRDPHLTLSMPSRTLTVPMGDKIVSSVALNPNEYNQLVKYSAGLGVPGATPLQEHLDKFVQQPGYKQASDAKKQLLIKDQISIYKQNGRKYFLSKNKGVMLKLISQAQDQGNNITQGVNGQLSDGSTQ